MNPPKIAELTFLFMVVSFSEAYVEESKYIYGAKLKIDEPLNVSTFYPKLKLYEASGSIGIKTFSQIHHIVELEMQDSMIDHIEDGALCSLPNLEELTIYKTKHFPALTLPLLSNCDKIKSFTAGGMHIEPNALQNMASLERLQIREQNISHLTKDYLQSLKKLESLEFFRCNIDQIDAGSICASSSLKYLTLHGISVPVPLAKPVFENCNTVTQFTLVYSDHVDIEEEAFTGLVNAKIVFLNNLKIGALTKGFLTGFSNVEQLRIEDSSFIKINSDALEGFSHLKSLTLTANKISVIEAGALSSLSNLDSMYISINQLSSLDNIANPNLTTLHASTNSISKIDAKVVKANLPNLKYLVVTGNNISSEYENQLKEELQGIHFTANVDMTDLWD